MFFFIPDNTMNDREGAQAKIARFVSSRQGRGVAAEVCTIRTTPMTKVSRHAFASSIVRLRQYGHPALYQISSGEFFFKSFFQMFFEAVHFKRRNELSIG